jgi:hypothetical protein
MGVHCYVMIHTYIVGWLNKDAQQLALSLFLTHRLSSTLTYFHCTSLFFNLDSSIIKYLQNILNQKGYKILQLQSKFKKNKVYSMDNMLSVSWLYFSGKYMY